MHSRRWLGAMVCLTIGCNSEGGGDGSGGSGSGGGPQFPGAGTSDSAGAIDGAELFCFYPPDGGAPAATVEYAFEQVAGADALRVRLIFDPSFVDNSYGVNAIGWSPRRGHTFGDLVKSDHAVVVLTEGGTDVFEMAIDYITADTGAPSGYKCLGVTGGEGMMMIGDAAKVLLASSSLDRNLNERGLSAYTVDSPATDASYTPNPAAPEWDFRVVYETWVDLSVFAGGEPGPPRMDFVHASPSKDGQDTVYVHEGECPPDWSDCTDGDGCTSGTGGTEMCVANEYGEGCFNGRDEDCDGLVDCADSDCADKCCTTDGDCPTGQVCTNNQCVDDTPLG